MLCEGCVITAEGSYFKLLNGEECNQKKVDRIKNKLNNMTNYINDYVIIDFFDPIPDWSEGKSNFNKDTIVFFQTIKESSFYQLNYYDVEIRIDGPNNHYVYACSVRKKEMLQLFDEICVKRKMPDLSNWKKIYDELEYGGYLADISVMTDERREKIKLNKEIVRKWCLDELPKEDYSIYFNALEQVSKKGWSSDATYQEMYCTELENLGLGNKIVEKFKYTTKPIILDIIGQKYLYGDGGVSPDYKKAYRYFYHAEKLGNMRSRYYRALMFKNGLHVKKNYNKYVKMIESIPEEFISAGGKRVLPCIDFAFVELAKIYKEKGDKAKCLHNAYRAQDLNDSRRFHFLEISRMPEILDIIYSMIPFDENDMDIYDLLYLLKKPAKAMFFANGKQYKVESVDMNGYCMVKFKNKYYKNAKEFFNKASIDGKKFYEWLHNVDYVEVI